VKIGDAFVAISRKVTLAAGSWQASICAIVVVLAWIIGGFFIGFNNELYQLFINTFTTICTFIMVFLIQGSQNRDGRAVQTKLSEIIRVLEKADDRLIDIEDATDERIERAHQEVCANKDGNATATRPDRDPE
jgi:low affinity Fe/Cu permease